jgi:hypothetical protein
MSRNEHFNQFEGLAESILVTRSEITYASQGRVVMVVAKKESRSLGMTGLHVGDGNVQRLFPPDVPVVELELDHLRIVCTLEPKFWDGDPEIHDERLISWLESKRMNGKLASRPAPLAMIPSGDHVFRLQPIQHTDVRKTEYAVGFSD